jgi:hypothetical protein
MNYIYDVLANFNSDFYDFYDWNDEDNIINIRRLPIIKVNSDFLYNVKYNDVFVDSVLLDKIYKKASFYNVNKNKYCYVCAICDDNHAFLVNFNSKGKVIGRSSMLLDEENEVIDICSCLPLSSFSFNVCSNIIFDFFKTRNEIDINNFIVDKLNSMSSDKLFYLYYDCFDEYESDVSKVLDKFLSEISNNFFSIYNRIYEFLELTSNK